MKFFVTDYHYGELNWLSITLALISGRTFDLLVKMQRLPDNPNKF